MKQSSDVTATITQCNPGKKKKTFHIQLTNLARYHSNKLLIQKQLEFWMLPKPMLVNRQSITWFGTIDTEYYSTKLMC